MALRNPRSGGLRQAEVEPPDLCMPIPLQRVDSLQTVLPLCPGHLIRECGLSDSSSTAAVRGGRAGRSPGVLGHVSQDTLRPRPEGSVHTWALLQDLTSHVTQKQDLFLWGS